MERRAERTFPWRRPRFDGRPGYEEVVQTEERYFELDSRDNRVLRVRIKNLNGTVVHAFLEDDLGVRFKNKPEWPDRQN